MASNSKSEFLLKKNLFDQIAEDVVCHVCKIVPRKPPIYHLNNGKIICGSCKDASPGTQVHRQTVTIALEKLLFSLPTSCKFKDNGCDIVQDRRSIEYHEEDCNFRDVNCFYDFCQVKCSFESLEHHLRQDHPDPELWTNKLVPSSKFGNPKFPRHQNHGRGCKILTHHEKTFYLLYEADSSSQRCTFYVMLYGSKFEAMNFKYLMKIESSDDGGKYSFEGQVKSIDDDKDEVFKSGVGCLVVPLEAVAEKEVQGDKETNAKNPKNKFFLEVEIFDLKALSEENTDQNSDIEDEVDEK